MGEDSTFYKGVFLMALVFGAGFGVGYKVKRPALLYSLHHAFPSMIPRLIFLLFQYKAPAFFTRQKNGEWNG